MQKYVVLLFLFLAGCASAFEQGLNAERNGYPETSYDKYVECIKTTRDLDVFAACQNNIGSLIYNGKVDLTKRNVGSQDAIALWTKSASYGCEVAQQNLRMIGRDIPPLDPAYINWKNQKSMSDQQWGEVYRQWGYIFGYALGSAAAR